MASGICIIALGVLSLVPVCKPLFYCFQVLYLGEKFNIQLVDCY